ncbi:MAG: transporter substrate-binding domain-containing protein [Gammaproteobacteria bacterium]|nr:transporter substrate-binding domain-containing protein [Gammaproteobacteria bacterium]
MNNRYFLTTLFIILLSCFAHTPSRADSLELTSDEKAWLKQHPVIRIGIDAAYAPYSFTDKKNQYVGVAPDLLSLLEKRLNIRFEPAPNLSWPQIVEGARQRKLDVIATAVITEERKQFLSFSQIYIPTPLVIMARVDDERVQQRTDIRQQKIALVEGYSASQQVIAEFPDIRPQMVATPLDGLRAVATGEADAYLGVLGINVYLMSQHGITNLRVAARYNVETNGQRLGVRKDWPQLVSILDKALNDISEVERLAIMRKWVPVNTTSTDSSSPVELSQAEQDFLAAHPVIRVANELDWPPFDFVDKDGTPSGFSIDYFKLATDKVGLRINWVNGYGWDKLLQMGFNGQIDAFPAIIQNPKRSQHLLFSPAYHRNISGYFAQKGKNYSALNDPQELKKYRLALVKGFADYQTITEQYPEVPVVTVDTVLDGLKAVAAGDADLFIGDVAVCRYLIEKHLLRGLYQAGRVQLSSLNEGENLRFAVRKDWPELLSLLEKGMQAISKEEIQSLRYRWTDIPAPPLLTKQRLIALAIFTTLLGLVMFLAWVWSLRRQRDRLTHEVGEQTRALYESEQRLSLALEGGGMAAFDVNYETGEIVVSKGWWSMMDLVEPNTPNPRERWLDLIHPDDRNEVLHKAGDYMKGKLDRYKVEYRALPPGGSIRWQVARGIAIDRANDSRPTRMVGLIQDITEHKELERIKDEFIASVSHELRTPLTSIKGSLGLVTGGATGQLPAEAEKILKIAHDNSERLNLLINDLLDIEKLRAGRMKFIMSRLKINAVIEESIQANQAYVDKYHVGIEFDNQLNNESVVEVDKNRILQVLANLISNAAKFSPTGGRINLRSENNNGVVRVSVSDEGEGIPEEFHDRIFERFTQVESGDVKARGGTGLGLAISREIIEQHKGHIGFQTSSKGTTFYFDLPVYQ